MTNAMFDAAAYVVAEARARFKAAQAAVAEFKTTNEEYLRLQQDYTGARERKDTTEDDLRQLGLTTFKATGERKPHPAVQVKDYGETEVDWDAATEWCKTNAPAFLTIDQKAFLNYLKTADQPPDFVAVTTVRKVNIMSAGLPEVDDD